MKSIGNLETRPLASAQRIANLLVYSVDKFIAIDVNLMTAKSYFMNKVFKFNKLYSLNLQVSNNTETTKMWLRTLWISRFLKRNSFSWKKWSQQKFEEEGIWSIAIFKKCGGYPREGNWQHNKETYFHSKHIMGPGISENDHIKVKKYLFSCNNKTHRLSQLLSKIQIPSSLTLEWITLSKASIPWVKFAKY